MGKILAIQASVSNRKISTERQLGFEVTKRRSDASVVQELLGPPTIVAPGSATAQGVIQRQSRNGNRVRARGIGVDDGQTIITGARII